MNNSIMRYVYIIGGVVVLAIIGFVFFGFRSGAVPSTGSTPTITKAAALTTLKALLALGVPQHCTFSNATDQSGSSGDVYIANGMMRGNFTSNSAVMGKTVESHMIVKDDTSYVWSSAMPQGIKMSFDAMQKPSANPAQKPAVDVNQALNYSCAPWTTDASMFDLPTNITFTDMSAMMQNLQKMIPAGMQPTGPKTQTGTIQNPGYSDIKKMQCRACDQAPEPQKSQCRAALGC